MLFCESAACSQNCVTWCCWNFCCMVVQLSS